MKNKIKIVMIAFLACSFFSGNVLAVDSSSVESLVRSYYQNILDREPDDDAAIVAVIGSVRGADIRLG